MITTSHSQSGQDRFVDAILEGKHDGVFLDVGANHPVELSNTYALESDLGWTGLLIDRDDHCVRLCMKMRRSPILNADALNVNWHNAAGQVADWAKEGAGIIDYLSLDCDENNRIILPVLLDTCGVRFRVLTVETDLYRFGLGPRDLIDGLLKDHGYDVLCRNVRASGGEIYESWAVDPKLVNMVVAEKYRSDGLKWSEILAKA